MKYLKAQYYSTVVFFVGVWASSLSHASTINLGWEANVRSFDPRNNVDANSQYLENLIHCSLVDFDESGSVKNSLAKTIEWDSSGKILNVTIKEGILFSSGDTVSPKDVVNTYQSLILYKSFARHSAFKELVKVSSPGKNQVQFELRKPDATFLTNLVVGILPSDTVKKDQLAGFQTPGCGPYRISKKSVNSIDLVSSSKYNLGPKPKTKSVSIKIVKSEQTRLAKLRAGELDIVQNLISRDAVKTIEKRYPDLKVQKRPALKTTYLGFNTTDPILKSRLVRQAISHAIHRQPIIDIILGGLATPAATMLPPTSMFYDKKLSPRTFDLKKANQLLDQAGFPKKGKYRFKLSYKTTTNSTRIQIAKAIASQLRKVGIKIKVEPMEWGRFSQDVAAGRVQMWSLTWIGFKDPDIYRYAFATESIPPNGGNRGFFSNQQLDELLEIGRTTAQQDSRIATYHKVQKIVSEECPYVFLWHEENFAVLNDKVQGFNLFADGRFSSLTNVTKN